MSAAMTEIMKSHRRHADAPQEFPCEPVLVRRNAAGADMPRGSAGVHKPAVVRAPLFLTQPLTRRDA
jgi:hypothetical protein